MKRYSTLFVLTLGTSVFATASSGPAPSAQPASMFVLGCGLVLLTVAHLAWKSRRIGK
jgi:hypothetical protein